MGNIRSGLLAAAVGIAVLAPQAASANVITVPFTITQTTAVASAVLVLDSDSPVAEFNPADGTLTSVGESLMGTATWTSSTPGDSLIAFVVPGPAGAFQFFFTPGPITFDISASTSDPSTLNDFMGTGSQSVQLLFNSHSGDTFKTGSDGLMGVITYTFTPAVAAVPEPSTWAMMVLGFAGLGYAGYRKTRCDNALA
jgi:hypothetical protein